MKKSPLMAAMQPPLVLNEAFVAYVGPALYEVWNYIGSDLEQGCREMGERLTNEVAVESVLDADRLLECCSDKKRGAQVHKYLKQMYDKYGYRKVFKFLCKHIRYA